MKKWLIIIAVLLVILIGAYLAIFKMAVPKAAEAFIPLKWQNIPLGQSKTVVHHYLGEPDTVVNGKEYWEQHLNSAKKYVLDVEYLKDTISGSYRVNYEVEILGFNQATEVKSDTLKR
jgi:hypothetical protein